MKVSTTICASKKDIIKNGSDVQFIWIYESEYYKDGDLTIYLTDIESAEALFLAASKALAHLKQKQQEENQQEEE